jgi:hypothetical protein
LIKNNLSSHIVYYFENKTILFFCTKGDGIQKDPADSIKAVTGTICRKVLSNLALGDLLSKDKDNPFKQNTLGQKKKMQSSPRASPPPFAGVLKAKPPRNQSLLLGSSFPATTNSCGPPLERGE